MNFEALTQSEISRVLDLVPAPVVGQLQREDVVLAGGIIRDTIAGLPVKDIDIFCHSGEQAERLACEVSTYVRHTTFAYTATVAALPVQYVFYKDFTDARDLVSQFDFRACCAGIYFARAWETAFAGQGIWRGVAVEGFHADCATRQLRFMSQPKDNGKLTALARALAFAGKGWTISPDETSSIIAHWEGDDTPERKTRIRCAFRPGYR